MIGDHVIEKREVYTKYPEIVVTLTVDGDNMVVVSIPVIIMYLSASLLVYIPVSGCVSICMCVSVGGGSRRLG